MIREFEVRIVTRHKEEGYSWSDIHALFWVNAKNREKAFEIAQEAMLYEPDIKELGDDFFDNNDWEMELEEL
jgi:deferrochelatase/peroxidase EfeB